MNRRDLISLIGGAAAWPVATRAQQAKVWRIGFLPGRSLEDWRWQYDGFVQGMRDLGYVEGKDFVSEVRAVGGRYERAPELAAELVALKVDLLITGFGPGVRALQAATRTIPIVFASVPDPISRGFVASLAHPGGNTTGLAGSYDDSSPKRLELLTSAAPGISRIGFLQNPDSDFFALNLKNAQATAQRAGLALVPIGARDSEGIENAFAAFGKERAEAVMVEGDPFLGEHRQQIAALALKGGLPSISPQLEYAQAGGLMSYGESETDFMRRAASYADRIIKGAKPADIPVELPTRFHLVINRKTADALGLTIAPALYIFADEFVEQ
jgi:putative ABC transport system substrate-binding protein